MSTTTDSQKVDAEALKQFPWRGLPSANGDGTAVDSDELQRIRSRYEAWILGGNPGVQSTPLIKTARQSADAYIRKGWAGFEALDIAEDGSGPAIEFGRGGRYPTSHHVFYDVLLPLVMDYRCNKNTRALESALRIFAWVEKEGFFAGSEKNTEFLSMLFLAPYAHATALLRKELAGLGRLEKQIEAIWYYARFNRAFQNFDKKFVETNADALRGSVFNVLVTVLAMEPGPRQTQLLHKWRAWLENALSIQPRFGGVLKPDGTGWHHVGIYASTYSAEAYQFSALAVYLLHGTSLAIGGEAVENLKQALRTHRLMAQKYEPPIATQGRIINSANPALDAFAYLALTSETPDPEMGGIFAELFAGLIQDDLASAKIPAGSEAPKWVVGMTRLREQLAFDLDGDGGKFICSNTLGRLELLGELAEQNIPPVSPPEGFWSKPWGALALHRRQDWLVSVKGWSQYIWDFEMHPKMWAMSEENVFGRRVSHGTLQLVTRGTAEASGWRLANGWDWSRWPGTTAIAASLQQLYDPETSWACRFFSAATFVGAVESSGQNGVFAMRLRDHYYEPGFHALKSYFFFDREIICLGSNIESRDGANPVETTLFQCGIPDASTPVELNGEPVSDEDFQWTGSAGTTVTLLDPAGNGTIVPDGSDLKIRRGVQVSRDAWNTMETRGFYTTCWLDHGTAPRDLGADDAFYEYTILIQARPGELAALASAPSHQVLRRDHRAHLIHHRPCRTTAGAVFESDWIIPEGPVRRTDTAILFAAREEGDGVLRLSVADPDLRLPHRRNFGFLDPEAMATPSRPSTVRLQVRGHWSVPEGTTNPVIVSHAEGDEPYTVLCFECRNGATVEVRLRDCGFDTTPTG